MTPLQSLRDHTRAMSIAALLIVALSMEVTLLMAATRPIAPTHLMAPSPQVTLPMADTLPMELTPLMAPSMEVTPLTAATLPMVLLPAMAATLPTVLLSRAVLGKNTVARAMETVKSNLMAVPATSVVTSAVQPHRRRT
jgi:hypothetical protein